MVTAMVARPFSLAGVDRATYHAAAVFASNFVVALMAAAGRATSEAAGGPVLPELAQPVIELARQFGVVSLQLIGVKNISAANALAKYGEDLFIKENDKKEIGKEKIDEKIFEIERRLLIRKRS